MAKISIFFGALLIILGIVAFWGTGSVHPTALIPIYFGLPLVVFGYLAKSPVESRRKLYMHINVTVGLLGFLGAVGSAIHEYGHSRSLGIDVDEKALAAQLIMAALTFIYVNMCVRSFIAARQARKAE
jgi:fucose 4-O-acetylase-like acetyltransferase